MKKPKSFTDAEFFVIENDKQDAVKILRTLLKKGVFDEEDDVTINEAVEILEF